MCDAMKRMSWDELAKENDLLIEQVLKSKSLKDRHKRLLNAVKPYSKKDEFGLPDLTTTYDQDLALWAAMKECEEANDA